MEKAYEAGKATEEQVLDGVMALGRAYMWMGERNECGECFETAREGLVRLLDEGSAKALTAAYRVACNRHEDEEEKAADLRRLCEMAMISLPDEAVSFDIKNSLGYYLRYYKGEHKEAKMLHLAALEGRRRVLGEEHKDTLALLHNMGYLLWYEGDYEGALD